MRAAVCFLALVVPLVSTAALPSSEDPSFINITSTPILPRIATARTIGSNVDGRILDELMVSIKKSTAILNATADSPDPVSKDAHNVIRQQTIELMNALDLAKNKLMKDSGRDPMAKYLTAGEINLKCEAMAEELNNCYLKLKQHCKTRWPNRLWLGNLPMFVFTKISYHWSCMLAVIDLRAPGFADIYKHTIDWHKPKWNEFWSFMNWDLFWGNLSWFDRDN